MRTLKWFCSGVALGVAVILASCEVGREHVLVVYTSMEATEVEAVEDGFEAAYPDVDVRMVAISPEDALDRLRKEKGGSQADVWWGAPVEALTVAGAEDLLFPSSPSWSGATGEGPADSDAPWHAVSSTPFVFAFNIDEISRGRMPRDWADLFHPRRAGEVLLPDPLDHAATALLVGVWIVREQERTGDEEAGFDWLRRLEGVAAAYPDDVLGVVQSLRAGRGTVGILPLDEVTRAAADGRPWLHHTFPESGSPMVVSGVALLAGSEARAQGEVFLEYLGGPDSAAAQGRAAWPVDYEHISTNIDAWVDRWRTDIRGSHPPFRGTIGG